MLFNNCLCCMIFHCQEFSGRVKGLKAEAVDTTGAGDAFVAGILSQLALDTSLLQVILLLSICLTLQNVSSVRSYYGFTRKQNKWWFTNYLRWIQEVSRKVIPKTRASRIYNYLTQVILEQLLIQSWFVTEKHYYFVAFYWFFWNMYANITSTTTRLQNEDRLRDALRFANACGALTVMERGAIPALPTRETVLKALLKPVA